MNGGGHIDVTVGVKRSWLIAVSYVNFPYRWLHGVYTRIYIVCVCVCSRLLYVCALVCKYIYVHWWYYSMYVH